jgi:hypothetical protein
MFGISIASFSREKIDLNSFSFVFLYLQNKQGSGPSFSFWLGLRVRVPKEMFVTKLSKGQQHMNKGS